MKHFLVDRKELYAANTLENNMSPYLLLSVNLAKRFFSTSPGQHQDTKKN